ncbi:MAG: MBL fold metallo-hydrolase [Verrucomicrobiae bacterium]|nr:MBL fold metallo-hydrolase [Verrucomicrobiae bacterium]
MIIRCWGIRGSIPVSGRDYIKYGGDTTCVEVRAEDNQVLILDAGSGIRRLGNQLLRENIRKCHLLFTHAHWDHLLGFPFFKPIYDKRSRIELYGCPFAQKSVRHLIGKTMVRPNFPVDFKDVRAKIDFHGICMDPFKIHRLHVEPVLLSHPNQGIGYKLVENGKVFVFLTDNELTYHHRGGLRYEDYRKFCRNADLLLHDAEYTPAEYPARITWGHSVYTDVVRLAIEAGVKKLGFIHHNQDRADCEVAQIEKKARAIIRKAGSPLHCFAAAQDQVIRL